MPNWCENNVTITHDDDNKLKELHEAMIKGTFLSFVIPIPEELQNPLTSSYGGPDREFKDKYRKKMIKKHGFESWYDFCVEKWGTKWEVEIHSPMLNDEGELFASFSSAWSPPTGVYQELTRQGFDVDARFCEFGMAYVGSYTSKEGELIYNFNNMPEELDEEFRITESLKEWEEESG